jgi:hypothetical protein
VKASSPVAISFLPLGIASCAQMAQADTADANCEGRKNGDTYSLKPIVTFNSSSYGNNGYNNNAYGAAGYGAANGSSECQRGFFNDAIKGRQYDQNRHPQDYKDGFRAGEGARAGHDNSGYANGNSSNGDYSINRMSNSGFEVV